MYKLTNCDIFQVWRSGIYVAWKEIEHMLKHWGLARKLLVKFRCLRASWIFIAHTLSKAGHIFGMSHHLAEIRDESTPLLELRQGSLIKRSQGLLVSTIPPIWDVDGHQSALGPISCFKARCSGFPYFFDAVRIASIPSIVLATIWRHCRRWNRVRALLVGLSVVYLSDADRSGRDRARLLKCSLSLNPARRLLMWEGRRKRGLGGYEQDDVQGSRQDMMKMRRTRTGECREDSALCLVGFQLTVPGNVEKNRLPNKLPTIAAGTEILNLSTQRMHFGEAQLQQVSEFRE
ncbi:hypothetical protein C8R45DRAFT_1083206, partial [Mycena sanguinolenta]